MHLSATILAVLWLSGCGDPSTPEPTPEPTPTPEPHLPVTGLIEEFSGQAALEATERVMEFGPRTHGSEGLEMTRELIRTRLERQGWEVAEQIFPAAKPTANDEEPAENTYVNLVARFGETADSPELILATHYDSRSTESGVFPGANDAAASVAGLLELARILPENWALTRKVRFVFLDGSAPRQSFGPNDGLFGARFHAEFLAQKEVQPTVLVWGAVADPEFRLLLAGRSSPELALRLIGVVAAEPALEPEEVLATTERPFWGNDLPYVKRGFQTLFLGNPELDYLHTADDTLDKVSAESLQHAGTLTLRLMGWLLLGEEPVREEEEEEPEAATPLPDLPPGLLPGEIPAAGTGVNESSRNYLALQVELRGMNLLSHLVLFTSSSTSSPRRHVPDVQ